MTTCSRCAERHRETIEAAAAGPVTRWLREQLREASALSPPIEHLLASAEKGSTGLGWLQGIGLKTSDGEHIRITSGSAALTYLAVDAIERDRARPAIALDSSKEHHGLLTGWRNFPKHLGDSRELDLVNGRIELLGPDNKHAQLELDIGDSPHDAAIRAIRDVMKYEGLRHYAALQRLWSVEGGRSGSVRWTMDAHLAALAMSPAQRKRAEVREQVARIVETLTKLELVAYDSTGTLRARAPLVHVGTAFERIEGSQWRLEGMELRPNPVVYRGVRDEISGKLGSSWYPCPIELAQVDHIRHPYALTLGLLLPIRLRWKWKNENRDHLPIRGANLLQLAGIKYRSHNPGEAWKKLTRDLAELARIGMVGRWSWDGDGPGLDVTCRIYAAGWIRDRTIHGLRPHELPPPADIPQTGEELREWRKGKGLTQASAAEVLGVSRATVRRAEGREGEGLPPSVRKGLGRVA